MGLLAHLATLSQVAIMVTAGTSHVVTDPYVSTHWNACPSTCQSSDSSHWGYYNGLRILKTCDEPMLLNFPVYTPIRYNTNPGLLACSLPSDETLEFSKGQIEDKDIKEFTTKKVDLEVASRGEESSQSTSHSKDAAKLVQAQIDHAAGGNASVAFGYSNGVALAAYVGSHLEDTPETGILASFIEKLNNGELKTTGSMMQICDENRSGAFTAGVISEANSDYKEALAVVQEAIATWNDGECVQGYKDSRKSQISIKEISLPSGNSSQVSSHAKAHAKKSRSALSVRDECRTIQLTHEKSCTELATTCGISPADFTKYNPSKTLCGNLQRGQHVCCSAGTKPDYSPKQNKDGTCATYKIKAQDLCSEIAAANDITVDDIKEWNKKTWKWEGCGNLPTNGVMCVSKGEPPMPATVPNAVCGPQKNGTKRPDNWDDVSDLNPCPLNACCDTWGQCGVTAEFCTKTNSTTGAPGTAKNGTNGCISNCGLYIKMNTDVTEEPVAMGYYEAFNKQRPCLNLDPQAILTLEKEGGENGSLAIDYSWKYIHFAFANITEDFQVDISTVKDEFDNFKKLQNPKIAGGEIDQGKVLSFGGWSFSTDLDSYAIFRKGVTDAQRTEFAENVVKFADDNDLDGLDFDWEYPGAPDIPGIPKSDPGDGERYLQFLKEVRDKLPSKKTLSVAVPASYWYLKGFPIEKISSVVDYIVYMTYDLHGQWDWDSPNGSDGCEGSSCLRSHVNQTEVAIAISMITKAGVPNNKIYGGVASYGRSFGMKDPSCHGPTCHFTGPKSGARPGECTQTAGYISNAEINEWLDDENEDITTYYDEDSQSVISYSKNGTWVAYNTKENRTARLWDWWYEGHLAGTALWAIDLMEFVDEDIDGKRMDPFYPANCTEEFDNMDDLEAATGLDDYCMNIYLMQALSGNLTASLDKYQDLLDDDYDKKFGWYEQAVRKSAPENLQSFLKDHDTEYFDCVQSGDADGGSNHTGKGCVHDRELGLSVDVYWTAHDKEKFEAALTAKTGIASNWLRYDMHTDSYHDSYTGNQGSTTNYGKPWLPDDFKIKNPKDVISNRYPNITAFHENLDFTATLANLSIYAGDTSDVVDSASILAFMVSSSVSSMAKVEDIGENFHEKEIINIILWFVTGVLFLIPGLEEGAELLEFADVAATLRLIGTAGDIGTSVYDVVQIKENGPAAVLGILLSGAGALSMLKAPEGFASAAKARRAISDTHINSLGTEVKGGMAQVEKLINRCY